MAKSYADKVREKMQKKAGEATSGSTGDPREWTPDVGTHRIRILPPVGAKFPKDQQSCSDDNLFYHTHRFHWVPKSLDDLQNKEGKFLWTLKEFDVNGKTKRCPICEAVDQWYSVGRAEKDQTLLNMGSALKLKRHFFMNVIRYTEDGKPEFRILVDRTNEGKLIKVICAAMGIPFFRDIEDNWVDKNSTAYDPDQEYYDLVDPEQGYDFKINREKTGNNNWDISYEKSFVIKKAPRALSDEELELMGSRVDLINYKEYVTDYNVVKRLLDGLLGEAEVEEAKEDSAPKKAAPKPVAKPATTKKPTSKDDDESMDDMLNELD